MRTSAEESLALAGEVSDRRDLAIARFYMGWALERQGNYERAVPLMEQSLREFQEFNDMYWQSVNYRWLGNRLIWRGVIHREEKVNRHLELARKTGERMNLANALTNKARLLFDESHFEDAKKCAAEASVLFKQIGSHTNELSFFFARVASAGR